MGRIPAPLLFAVLIALGLALRLAPDGERRLAPDERDLGGSRWLVDDPGTAAHLRRVELTLSEGRAPQRDPFLCFPRGAEIPALPLFDTLLAGTAERWLAHARGDPALAGVDEADLEDLALRAGPVLSLFGLAAAAWAAWIVARGRAAAALVATALLAVAPAAVRAGEIGRLDAAALALLLCALLVRSAQRALTAPDALSTILEALLAGVLAGLLTATSAAGVVLAAPVALGLFVRALRGATAEERAIARRAGLLFAVVAAFVSRLPLSEGPWESFADGLVASFALGASDLLLLASAPFALLVVFGPRDAQRGPRTFARMAVLAGLLAFLVYEAPRAAHALARPLTAWWESRAVRADLGTGGVLHGGTAAALGTDLTLPALLALPLAVWLVARRRDAPALHVAALLAGTLALTLLEPAFAPLCVLAAAFVLAAGLDAIAEAAPPRRAAGALAAAGILLAPHALAPWLARPDPAVREERIAFVAGLRWMRVETRAGGPFNSSAGRGAWGVLIDPAAAPLVAYHARRPAVAGERAALGDPAAVHDALVLARSAGATELVAGMSARSLRYAVAAPRYARDHDGALARLACDEVEVGELEPVHAAARRVGVDGRAPTAGARSGPAISIWRLVPEFAPREAELRAPR